ncbi:nitroreductase family protein [Pusillimonas caeni]|uniref:nitroreductase family protein n=1 Tax=Pusillimonas caeni TaxID=1348472 RepID=UPI001FD86B29|nr:nitroreductase family protein [Pusillimonas caeni]
MSALLSHALDPDARELDGPEPDTTLDEMARLLAGRRSVRRYLPIQPPVDLVDRLLYLGTCAPSAHNRQPWRFAVIRSHETKARLARAMGDKLRRDRLADQDDPGDIEADVSRSFARITSAPTIVLLCLTMEDMDRYREQARNDHEFHMATQSLAMAGQNIMLAAHAAGLSSCWMCAPMFCPDIVRGVLKLAGHWIPQGMLTLGYPANPGKPFRRMPPCETTLYLDEDDHHSTPTEPAG